MSNAPWWSYDRIDCLGCFPDPAGPYYKPDTNVQLSPGYPIIAISPGTVTSVQQTGWGQTVVTIRLDTPHNDQATHEFYEHMSDTTVQVGEHISQGDLIGHNNVGSPPLGFGFYSGDVYGSGNAWQQLQHALATDGNNSVLSPVAFLNSMKGVNTPESSGSGNTSLFANLPGNLNYVPIIVAGLIIAAVAIGFTVVWKELG